MTTAWLPKTGVEGIIIASAYYEAPWARGDIRIYSRSNCRISGKGQEDLSLGYSCRYI
ncbi:head maturation protease [Pseudomonas phage WP1]